MAEVTTNTGNKVVITEAQKAKLDEAGERAYQLGLKHRKNIIKTGEVVGQTAGKVVGFFKKLDKSGVFQESVGKSYHETLAPIVNDQNGQKTTRTMAAIKQLSQVPFETKQQCLGAFLALGLTQEEALLEVGKVFED